MSVCGTAAAAAARQSRCEPAPYAALPPELLDTIPKRVFIESDNWTGRRAWNALRQRHTVCVTAEDVAEAEAAAGVQRWSPPRSISPPELCCQTAAVRARILHWDSLAAAGVARRPSPPRPPRLKKRHTIAGARHSRPARPAVSGPVPVSVPVSVATIPVSVSSAMGGAGGRSVGTGGASIASSGGGGGGPTPTVLVQTWEARRSSVGAPVVLAPDSDGEGSVSSEGDWTADVQVHSVATQTVHSSRVVRRVPVGSNEVYMVQVCEPTQPVNGGVQQQQTHTAVTVHLPRQKQITTAKQIATTKQIVTTVQGQPPKPPRMLNIESGLDFTRDPPSFSSLHSAASSEGSQGGGSGGGGGGGSASGNGSGRLHEAINHDLVLAHEAARRNVLELRSGSVGTEAETVLRELDRALDSHGSATAVDRAGAGQHEFSSEFAAQMARESGGLASAGGKAGGGSRQRSESTSPQRRDTRTPESGSRSLDSEELSLESRTRSPEQPPPLSPADARVSSPRSAPSPARPPRRSPARHSTSPTGPSVSPNSPDASYTSHTSHLTHSSSAPPQSITSHDPASFTNHPSAARRVSNTENFNLVEEITDGSRSVLARSEDFESLSSGGYDMGDVGVTRMQTPSTPRATPTSSPAPRLESPVYATPDRVSRRPQHAVVVAIDFGTTYSGYAFSFASEPASIHVMRKAGGDDPGLNNQKTATALLLTPQADFSAFGFSARVAYHDLEPDQAAEWLYFDKFKLSLHTDASLSLDTYIPAANGRCISALLVFAHALSFFRRQALEELESVLGQEVPDGQIRWVITVPAIWRQHAKQFMRQAAYKAGLCAEGRREDLLIALEPEVASVYCHSLRMHELVHEGSGRVSVFVPSRGEEARAGAAVEMVRGTRYLVVDCGGGTVDITVHEVLDSEHRRLKEVYKASGGPYGSVGVDMEFVSLLCKIFGEDFVSGFRSGRPAAWINLMVAFEARKRAVCPDKASPLNIEIPVAFISEYKKTRGKTVEHAVKKYKDPRVRYTDDGMLRIDSELMHTLFEPTLDKITQQVEGLFEMVTNMQYLFLVGGFSESKMLQERMKRTFSDRIKVVIPQEVSLAILRGAVLFGLDPSVIQVRRSTMTYGVGVLNKFMRGIHPQGKLLIRDGREWCADIFDKFVTADQSVGVGETLLRRYTPARTDQTTIVLHLYCSHKEKVTYVTDDGVERCGTLKLTLEGSPPSPAKRREIQVRMRFGETEILASAVDLVSQRSVAAEIDFLS